MDSRCKGGIPCTGRPPISGPLSRAHTHSGGTMDTPAPPTCSSESGDQGRHQLHDRRPDRDPLFPHQHTTK